MSITIVKSKFHELIDNIEDKDLLLQFLEAMEYSSNRKPGELWSTLNTQQKSSVLTSYEQSLDKSNLIPLDKVAEKHQKWLTK